MTYKQRTKTSFPRDHWIVNPQNPGKFEGFRPFKANFTITPNDFFEMMPLLTGSEFKIVAYIVRQTLGFHKDRDAIGLRQFGLGIDPIAGPKWDYGTGLNKAAIIRAIKGAERKGVITALRKEKKRTIYGLRYKEPHKKRTISCSDFDTTSCSENDTTQKKTSKELPVGENSFKKIPEPIFKAISRWLKEENPEIENPEAYLTMLIKKYGAEKVDRAIQAANLAASNSLGAFYSALGGF